MINWKEIKDYLEILVLAPSILGGLWQIYELANISTSYIRFFSVSQVIPDGLLILFSSICTFFAYKASMLLRKALPFYKNKSDNWFLSVISIFIYITIGAVILYYYQLEFTTRNYFQLSDLTFFILFVTIFSSAIYDFFPFSFRKKIGKKISRFKNRNKDDFYRMKGFLILSFGGILLIGSLQLIENFRNSFINIGELNNINCLSEILDSKSSYQKTKIIYFNDKYIFSKTIYQDKPFKIEIFKTDILFEECGITAGNNG